MTETYPRVYRYAAGWTAVFIVCCIVFLAGAAALVIWRHQVFEHAPASAWIIAAVLAGMAFLTLLSLKCRTILYEDRLEYVGILARRSVQKADIKRTSNIRRGYTMVELTLELTDGRKIKVGDFGRTDDVFKQWFGAVPNAEAEAEAAHTKAMLANPAFGSNPTERAHHIRLDVDRINLMRWPCYGLWLWGMAWPYPYQVCLPVQLTLPILGLAATFASRGRWSMLEDNKGGRLDIGSRLFVGPAIVVALRAVMDDDVLDWVVPAAWGVAAGFALTMLNGMIERKLNWARALGFAIFWSLYALGGLMYANISLDPSQGRVFPVRVLHKSEGDHGASLTVTAWGPRPSGNEINVARSFARRVHKGDTVCVYLYPGRLNWSWYAVDVCPRGK